MGEAAARIEVEVYELDLAAFGSFVAEVPARPWRSARVELADGSRSRASSPNPVPPKARDDITEFGGWRAYIASLS